MKVAVLGKSNWSAISLRMSMAGASSQRTHSGSTPGAKNRLTAWRGGEVSAGGVEVSCVATLGLIAAGSGSKREVRLKSLLKSFADTALKAGSVLCC